MARDDSETSQEGTQHADVSIYSLHRAAVIQVSCLFATQSREVASCE